MRRYMVSLWFEAPGDPEAETIVRELLATYRPGRWSETLLLRMGGGKLMHLFPRGRGGYGEQKE